MKLSEFVPSPGSKVRVPASSSTPAGYLDGIEQRLLDALQGATDRSVGSLELAGHVTDWPTLYHLTPYRSTLFDCLGFHGAETASVLELGAGCGAITRWLGEHFGSVSAIEGSVERASVAAARCDDLDNVSVFAANYSLLAEREAFDAVTLIGVLEYGHLYHPSTSDPHAAAADNLRVAYESLRDDSVLVLAIENRLGLKYLNGAFEDHSARPYDSVQGYPSTGGGVTFNRRELERLVREAGFDHVDTLLPFPDYKLASTIVDAAAAGDDPDLANWLIGTAPDRGGDLRAPSFSETLAQREVVRAGLTADLSNSLLLIAYRGDVQRTAQRLGIERGWRARHYSLNRRPSFRKRVTLTGDGTIVKEPALGARRTAESVEVGLFEHHLGAEERAHGELAIFDVLSTIAREGIGSGLVELVRRYAHWLQSAFGTDQQDAAGVPLLRGDALDAVWSNIVVDRASGAWRAIDREWRFRGSLPLDFVVWRNVAMLAWSFREELPVEWRALDEDEIALRILVTAGIVTEADRFALAKELERAFQDAVSPGPTPVPSELVQSYAAGAEARFCVLAHAEELIASPDLLRAYATTFDAAEPATLLLFADRAPADVVPKLRGAIAAADLDEDTMPDTVFVEAGGPAFGEAVLTGGVWGPEDLPRFAVGEMAALRALAERTWATHAHAA
ncbi:class I SAM-dependent methyltransferase [Baekduia alba]|uniref:class I SAM-dependent methyltransferase n=1 Tax=Baekduia alba TaxID=2997333 RepID=UPI0023403668|nr:class I SAM-dependent methyltransferase [Baekduia alba]